MLLMFRVVACCCLVLRVVVVVLCCALLVGVIVVCVCVCLSVGVVSFRCSRTGNNAVYTFKTLPCVSNHVLQCAVLCCDTLCCRLLCGEKKKDVTPMTFPKKKTISVIVHKLLRWESNGLARTAYHAVVL